MNPVSSSTPLGDVFPWPVDEPKSILVADSVATDGRFLLHSWACQIPGNFWWIAGGPWTPSLITAGLQKMGRSKPNDDSVIRSLPAELNEEHLENGEAFLKEIYREIKAWVQTQKEMPWIFLDDVSAIAGLLGSRLTYIWILSLQALAMEHSFGLFIRCSHDSQQQQVLHPPATAQQWIGAGATKDNDVADTRWEATLIELVDWVLDVVPLASGYTREAHGRLVLSCRRDRMQTIVYNYCLTDQKALAIRVQSTS